MPPTIHHLPLTPEHATFLSTSLAELQSILLREPLHLSLQIEPLPAPLADCLLPQLNAPDINGLLRTLESLSSPTNPFTLLISCDPSHPIARAARSRLPHAHWGLTLQGHLAICYHPHNKFLLWHETLHLLGIPDHYDPRTLQPTCSLPTCIMQYAPSPTTIGPATFLCPQLLNSLSHHSNSPN